MDCHALALRQLPHQPKLFLEYLNHFEKVKSFYVHPPAMPAVTREARKLDHPGERRAEVTSILRRQNIALGAGAETLSNLDRLEKAAVAVVSGQQVGLFSGPTYSVYKALTAVQIAEELTREGIPAMPDRKLPAGRNIRQRVRQIICAVFCAAGADPDGPAR